MTGTHIRDGSALQWIASALDGPCGLGLTEQDEPEQERATQ